MRTKTLGELIRDYGRAMNIAGNYAARAEQVKANALYAEIEKRLTNDDVPQLTS